MIVLRFFRSKRRETVQPSARVSTQSFLDQRVNMLGEMLGEMLDRLTTNFKHQKNVRRNVG